MSYIETMIDDLIQREGGFVNDPMDRGGPTCYGITQKTLSYYLGRPVTVAEVKNLSQDLARNIYHKRYYLKPKLDYLPGPLQPLVFDMAVNQGPRIAIICLQKVCQQMGFGPLKADGILGPKTQRAVQRAFDAQAQYLWFSFLAERRRCYLQLVKRDVKQIRFLKGWMRRVAEFELMELNC